MKKIKSIKHLRTEKKKLRRRKSELEEQIKNSWGFIKQNFVSGKSEKTYTAGGYSGKEAEEKKQDSFFEDLFAFLAGQVARKMAGKAEEKFSEWFNK
jgi:hypothetical protein